MLMYSSLVFTPLLPIMNPSSRSARLKRRIFWDMKAGDLLLRMLKRFPDISNEMFVLSVDAVCALSHLIGINHNNNVVPAESNVAASSLHHGSDEAGTCFIVSSPPKNVGGNQKF